MDSKTPAQVAEDCERELTDAVDHLCNDRSNSQSVCVEHHHIDEAITRALAARAWATAEEMIDLAAFDCTPATGPEARQKAERDRLRREYEEASK